MQSKAEAIYQQWKYPVVIGLMFLGLVFSKWVLSSAQFLLLFAVLSDKTSRSNLAAAFRSPIVLSLISLYVLHAAGMLWTTDFKYGMRDLQIKLPILVFPILFFAAGPQKKRTATLLLLFFVGSVLLLSIISLINFYISPVVPERIAIGQSHIRFSLLICLSVFFMIHFSDFPMRWFKWALIPATLTLLCFLIILESFTGYAVLFFLLFFLPFLYWNYLKKRRIRFALIGVLLITAIVYTFGFINVKHNCFPRIEKTGPLEQQTINGNYYLHDTVSKLSENGNYLYLYFCEKEMVNAWNMRSKKQLLPDDSTYITRTNMLIRYLSSKSLRKDSVGVMQLSEKDIQNIEDGYSNYRLPNFDPYRERIYRFLWELNIYRINNDPSGHSLTQRFEYWKAATRIIKQQPWFGTGTGDIVKAFQEEYDNMGSNLEKEYRLRSHNQFLSITVAFGFFGLLIFIYTLLSPFLLCKNKNSKLYLGFIFIFLLSLLNEDTLETQVGVTFYALFNSFLLFIFPNNEITAEHEKK